MVEEIKTLDERKEKLINEFGEKAIAVMKS